MKQLIGVLLIIILCSPYITVSGERATLDSEEQRCVSYIPSAISPNGDGINDFFEINFKCEPKYYSVRIYDSASRLVHESNHLDQRWDGSVEGKPGPEGAYAWVLSYALESGPKLSRKGEVLLIR